jgi:hypothetical protein
MQYPPRLDQLGELIQRGRMSHWAKSNLLFAQRAGLTPKSRSGKGQSGGFGPAGAFFMKNAG